MGNVGFENLKELALTLRDTYNLTTFIETGTYKAQTTAWAAENFEKVISIEADESWHNKAKAALEGARELLGVAPRLILGDSAVEFPKVIKRFKKPCLIWLDAHWCKAGKAARSECPLLKELEAIRETGIPHLILIDDARLFQNPPNSDWPTMAQIGGLMPDNYEIVTWNDAIIAVPGEVMKVARRYISPQPLEPVILASNLYLHCLPPFAYLFNKFWPGQSAKVVRYEVRPPSLPDNFTNYAIGKQVDYTWSSGLLKYLDDHQGELILLMLEDYFINGMVHKNTIEWAWKFMLEHPEVAKFDLSDDRLKVPHSPYWKEAKVAQDMVIKSASDAPFQTSLQAAIWRVDFLRRFLDPKEDAWQFEKHGTRRVIAAKDFDRLILGFKNPPLSYINAIGGEGGNPGLWDNRKIPPWMVEELSRKRLM